MTSAATQPARGTGGHRAEGHGYGLALFASVLLVSLGCFNLIYGIAAIASAHVFTVHAHYVFGSLNSWRWIILNHRRAAVAGGGRGGGGQPAGPLVRRGHARPERDRSDVFSSRPARSGR